MQLSLTSAIQSRFFDDAIDLVVRILVSSTALLRTGHSQRTFDEYSCRGPNDSTSSCTHAGSERPSRCGTRYRANDARGTRNGTSASSRKPTEYTTGQCTREFQSGAPPAGAARAKLRVFGWDNPNGSAKLTGSPLAKP